MKKLEFEATLIDINPQDYTHSPDKLDFLGIYSQPTNSVRLKKSNNTPKIAELVNALDSINCWEQQIFEDTHLPYYAMSAYLDDKISRDQITHVLEFHELRSTYRNTITIPLLGKDGNFTLQVKEILEYIPTVTRSKLPKISPEHIDQFRKRVVAEQQLFQRSAFVFHIIPSNEIENAYVGITSITGAIHQTGIGTVVFPISVRNIFFQAIAPLNSTKAISQGKLGPFSLDDIEKKQRQAIRPCATTCPDAYRSMYVHRVLVIQSDSTNHDVEHQGASSYFPAKMYDAVLLAVDVIRAKTKIKWSLETWTLIDGYFIDSNYSVIANAGDKAYKVDEALTEYQGYRWFKNILSTSKRIALYIVVNDMQSNPEKWLAYIDVKSFLENNIDCGTKETLRVKTLEEISTRKDVALQFLLGYLFQWPGFKDTKFSRQLSVSKSENNNISLFVYGEPADHFENETLVVIAKELTLEKSILDSFAMAAKTGNHKAVELAVALNDFSIKHADYIRIAFRLAAINGHIAIVASLLPLLKKFAINFNCHYIASQIVSSGQKEAIILLLDEDITFINSSLKSALRHDLEEIFSLLLARYGAKIPINVISEIIIEAFKRDKVQFLQLLMNHINVQDQVLGNTKSYTELILSELHIMDLRLDSYKQALKILLTIIPNNHPVMLQLCFAIAKAGCIEAFDEFIQHIAAGAEYCEDKSNSVLLYILHSLTTNTRSMASYANLHYPIVRYQIDCYLTTSSNLNRLAGQKHSPRLFDINRLLKLILKVNCELGLYYLLNHKMINKDPELKEFCLNLAMEIFFQHSEAEFEFVLVKDKAELGQRKFMLTQMTSEDCAKIELIKIENVKPLTDPKKWQILHKLPSQEAKKESVIGKSTGLYDYLIYIFKDKNPTTSAELTYLKGTVARHINFPTKETYYLRMLLSAGLKLTSHYDGDKIIVNSKFKLGNIVSSATQCLLWLYYAIEELKKPHPQSDRIKLALNNAAAMNDFKRELLLVIYGKSIPINIYLLKQLKHYFDTTNKAQQSCVKLLQERLSFLRECSESYLLSQSFFKIDLMNNKCPEEVATQSLNRMGCGSE